MKISCQSCQAKYTIADEKVLGKIVKIRCKKCSATIVINGNEAPSASAGPAVYDYTAQGSAEQWTVNVADGDQRTMTSVELIDGYKAGVVTDETFCWKDGMSDWLPLREIEVLYAMCAAGNHPSLAPDAQSHHDAQDEQPTRIQESNLGSLFGGGDPAPAPAAHMPEPSPNGFGAGMFGGAAAAPAPTAAAAAAARRAGGRGAPGTDLFGGAAHAGGEDDVMTSVQPGAPQAHGPGGDKMTGERNENSVLFSLSALTNTAPGKGAHSEPPPAMGEASGLIDIRALSAGMAPASQRSNKVDDIMNLAGGGAFTPSLTAPVLAASAFEAPDYAAAAAAGNAEAQASGGNKTLLFAIIGGAVVVVLALVVVFFVILKSPDDPTAKTTPSSTTSAVATTTATTATVTATATTTTPVATSAAPPDTAPTTTTTASAPPSATTTATATVTTTATTKPTATTTTTVTAPATTTAPPSSDQPPFNLDAAKSSLKAVAGGVGGCAKPGGPTGSGTVLVQFRGNGSVQTAQVQGSPFAGTPVGACVAGRFFGARVPAFSGSAPPLTKSFTIN